MADDGETARVNFIQSVLRCVPIGSLNIEVDDIARSYAPPTIGAYAARSLGASALITRIAGLGAGGFSSGAAYGTTALAGGIIGLTMGSAINCR